MTRIVLIDGENLIYGLRKVMGTKSKKAPRDLFIEYPFRELITQVLGDDLPMQIFFYGARLRQYDFNKTLLQKTKAVIAQQAKLSNALQKQKIHFVKAGYLRARETDPCPKCQHSEWHLLEKGVDVGLAVKMITDTPRGAEVVLVSSDTDLLPAIKAVKIRGAKLTYVGFEDILVMALVGAANRTRVITAKMVKDLMKEVEK